MEQKRLTLRIPIKLYDKLNDAMELSGKTLTGEILDRVNYSFESESELDKRVRAIVKDELSKK